MTRALVTALAALGCAVTGCASAAPDTKEAPAGGARADFHAICPFTVAAPSVFAVRDAKRWQTVLNAARTVPPPYEAGATNFRRELIVVVALPHTSTPITRAALSEKRPPSFDAATGTLTIWYDVEMTPIKPGEGAATVLGEPCLVTWVPGRKDLQQIVTRTSDGRYIAGTRLVEKPRKKGPTPVPS